MTFSPHPGPLPEGEGEDWRPTASWRSLARRAALLRRLRGFFEARGFVEVETPLLSADSVIDRHLDPLRVTLFDDAAAPEVGPSYWLQTSPEFGMKRLLAAGAEAIFQVTRAFRGGERGRLHNPEFTMVEWYRAGDGLHEGIGLLADLACEMLQCEEVERLTYAEAFERWAGVDPHRAEGAELAAVAKEHNIAVPENLPLDDRDGWLNLLLADLIEPNLGQKGPTILYDYPASQAALARVREEDPPVAERFELYASGIELANGYHELLDAEVLARRNRQINAQRLADGKYPLPEESRLLAAMRRGLPPCAGVALGFDRLAMLALGASSLAEVMPFPIDRA